MFLLSYCTSNRNEAYKLCTVMSFALRERVFRASRSLPSGAATMAPKPRALHKSPSCPGDLHPLQVTLLDNLTNAYHNRRETGETIRQMCHEYQVAYSSEGALRARAAEALRQVGVDGPKPWLSLHK